MQTILSIGRDASNNIVLDDMTVSRKHAELAISEDKKVLIRDLGSRNGSFVNGVKITEHFLQSNDIVKCGSMTLNWKNYVNVPSSNSTNFRANENPDNQYFAPQPPKSENKLVIGRSISDNLPTMVKSELAKLTAQRQQEFVEEYERKKKSLGIAYLLLIFVFALHYGYIRKWGLQIIFWLTGGGLLVWWIIDLFRLPGLIKDYNMDVATDVMRNLKIINNS